MFLINIPPKERKKAAGALGGVILIILLIWGGALYSKYGSGGEVIVLHVGQEQRLENVLGFTESGMSHKWAGIVLANPVYGDVYTTIQARRIGILEVEGIYCENGLLEMPLRMEAHEIKRYLFIIIP